MGSKMLQSTKLTLLDLIHQYKSSRQSNDSSIAAQRRKVPSHFNPPCPGSFDLQVHYGQAISSRQSSVLSLGQSSDLSAQAQKTSDNG